jgi:type VI secretion system FHA domain protein
MSFSIKISKKIDGRSEMIASRSWPQNRISIGRGEECTLVLEDPMKHVSRVHVELEEKDESTFHLTVASKVNPVFINGKKLAPGSRVNLTAGDRFELGEYELELLPPPAPLPKAGAMDSYGEETTRPDNPQLQMPEMAAAPRPAPPPPDPAADGMTFMGQKLPPIEPGIFDEPDAAAPPAPEPEPEAEAYADATYVGTSGAAPNAFDDATYVGGKAPLSAAAAQPAGGAGMRDAVKAFLDGAGLADKEIRDADIEVFLRQSGKILRAAIEGSMALLAARATAKKELRAEDRTMVASKDNNPLKLMSDAQEAMAFLFDTKERTDGFLAPVQAVGDAFEDLRAHEVALFAAMRAALLSSIQRFDPKTLEAELEKSSGGLGLNRKAKLWELFAAYQQKLARDADDDFNKVFGREFMGTYMAQVKRLRSGG